MIPLRNPPGWIEVPLTAGRKATGSGMFRHVHYLDITDGEDGRAVVRTPGPEGAGTGLSQVLSTGHEIGLEEDRFTTFLLPVAGQVFCASETVDLKAQPGTALILPPGRRRNLTRHDGGRHFQAIVLNLTDLPRPPDRASSVELESKSDLSLAARLLGVVCAGPACGAGEVLSSVRRLVLDTLLCETPESVQGLTHVRGVPTALARAEALLHDRFTEDLSIGAVAAEAGISPRQLQELFRRRHGLSPHAYLTRLRLEHAHLALKGALPALSVTEAALSAGFSHLGRFPGTYRSRFSTLPSDTRASLR